ncbi:MAG: class I SAM-dependent methyltransferase [Nostoc sp. DedQUE04]|uniref:class I SAM-dependent methyltransferase n=1 Tax=Nostoc sp. DedQUE04 TaxID=3075390 RepID=UPI002AD2B22E|nr:class I SAM-dependent methyltransferase [Nostoc sp. DedQUE04]MDZ8137625.1 class I SAM-dependent methyltransferase [Nostoc sp. DedQUE04]
MDNLEKIISKFDLNDGELAYRYSSLPYGYYKEETYPIFCATLDAVGDDIHVLDIGSGPGHLAFDFYQKRPSSKTRFSLMDSSYTFLRIAKERIENLGFHIQVFHRNYNFLNWERDLGKYDVIVSNNSLFHLKPDLVAPFYEILFNLLNSNAVFLNQQAFSPILLKESFTTFYKIMGPEHYMSEKDKAQMPEIIEVLTDIESDDKLKFSSEISKLKSEGWKLDETPSYASLNLSEVQHLKFMNLAGFISACIWRKMHFAVLVGLKGKPL